MVTISRKYENLTGYVWEEQILPYDLNVQGPEYECKGDFYEFMKDIAPKPPTGIPVDHNLISLKTIIGYLIHDFKNLAFARAAILLDNIQDGKPNGRSGKGLLRQGLSKAVKTVIEDGKLLKQTNQFIFSKVTESTKLLVIDDAKKGFDFEKLFSPITEDLTVERKNQNKFSIPFHKSPKILVTSNYTIGGVGKSHEGRRIEYALSDHYNTGQSPDEKFGKILFDDWVQEDWDQFFSTMINCLKLFLEKGVVTQEFNFKERELKMTASEEFIDYAILYIEPSTKYVKTDKFNEFKVEYPKHHEIQRNTFTRWIKLYAEADGLKYNESHSGNEDYFELTH